MKKTISFITTLFCLCFLMSLNSCGAIVKSKAKKRATVEKGAIPQDFGKEGTTMLFITRGKRSYDKYLNRNVKKAYKGAYKFIPFYELTKDTYKDLNQYPYYFDFRNSSSSYTNNRNTIYGPAGGTRTRTVRVFGITDRKTKKLYSLKMTSGFWSKLQRAYIQNMESERTKKQ